MIEISETDKTNIESERSVASKFKSIEVDLVKGNSGEQHETVDLVFKFDKVLNISLLSANTDELKTFFVQLMTELTKEKFTLDFKSESRDIYTNMSRSYIKHLNTEIEKILTEFPEYIDLQNNETISK